MCTSFVWRKNEDVLVAMNFDNNGIKFSLSLKDPNQFTVIAGGAPSFGVNSKGAFINHLAVDTNGKGAYKRGKNVIHTIKLITDVLSGKLEQENIGKFLSDNEIVNVPDNSCHCMISDKTGNVWIVEPGRGIISSPASESPYYIMTNFSLYDYIKSGKMNGSGADRYKTADSLLSKAKDLDVTKAFEVLNAVKQYGDEWRTEFSMVYAQKENAVYYCYNAEYQSTHKYAFT